MPPLQGPRASLCWTRKPLKTLVAAVVHADGYQEMILTQGVPEQIPGSGVEAEFFGHGVELLLGHFERVERLLLHQNSS